MHPGFGGRKCDQCEENYWGDPQVECFPCDCNPIGSMSFQCDHATGKCACLEGEEIIIGFTDESNIAYFYIAFYFTVSFTAP